MTAPLAIQRVHHVARVTRRPLESIAFYRDVLGFRELKRPNFNFRGAWLFNYGVQIHIIENTQAAPAPAAISPRENHLALEVLDLAAAKQNLNDRGIPFFEQVNAGGIHQVFFQDPDGHIIEIATYGPTPEFA